MKLSKEDIQKYGTEEEKKTLNEGKKGNRGRPSKISKFLEYKNWLQMDIERIGEFFQLEEWDDLEGELNTAIDDIQTLKMYI